MLRKTIATLSFLAFATTTGALYAADCTIAKDDDNAVAAACKKGGIGDAKKVMKKMVKKAKKAGKKWDCDSCHKNEEDWKLTSDGEKLFKEMLALQ